MNAFFLLRQSRADCTDLIFFISASAASSAAVILPWGAKKKRRGQMVVVWCGGRDGELSWKCQRLGSMHALTCACARACVRA
jgi:hypothetical protein